MSFLKENGAAEKPKTNFGRDLFSIQLEVTSYRLLDQQTDWLGLCVLHARAEAGPTP